MMDKLMNTKSTTNEMTRVFKSSASQTVIKDIKHYIETNFCEQLSVDSLAKQFSVYPGFITNNMKKKYHITPQKYWTALRIAKSKEILINTDADIAQIAREVGYKNIYVYCRAFQKIEGVSPREFREKVWNVTPPGKGEIIQTNLCDTIEQK